MRTREGAEAPPESSEAGDAAPRGAEAPPESSEGGDAAPRGAEAPPELMPTSVGLLGISAFTPTRVQCSGRVTMGAIQYQ
jgi:hypothetical protein